MKKVNFNQISKKFNNLRKNNKIVLCHGVFDLVHTGHLNHFKSAKKYGDILVVSVTPAKFVQKGLNRPINSDKERVNFLSELSVVDFVVLNNSKNATDIIKVLKPDYYVKGLDYYKKTDHTGEIKNEIKILKKRGGKIKFTKDNLRSSSQIINKSNSHLNIKQSNFIKKLKTQVDQKYLIKILNNIQNLETTILGEIIVDKYVFHNLIGKSGKESHLVLKYENEEMFLGGSGAIANHVSNFCKKVNLISYLGTKKNFYHFIKKKLHRNVNLKYFLKNNSPTILKTRYLDKINKNKIVGMYNLNDEVDTTLDKNLNNYLQNYNKKNDLLVISDYGHGLLNKNIVNKLNNKFKFIALNTQLNASSINYHAISKYKKADFLIINENELRHEFKDKNSSIKSMVYKLVKKINVEYVVVTSGSNGANFYIKRKKLFIHCPAYAKNIVDKVGSGDSMFAVMSLLLSKNCNPYLAIFLGSLAAAQNLENFNNKFATDKTKLFKFAYHMLS